MTFRPDPGTPNDDGREYESPRLVELGPLWKLTLIGKHGSLSDGIHMARMGGTLHNSSA